MRAKSNKNIPIKQIIKASVQNHFALLTPFPLNVFFKKHEKVRTACSGPFTKAIPSHDMTFSKDFFKSVRWENYRSYHNDLSFLFVSKKNLQSPYTLYVNLLYLELGLPVF